MRKRIYWAGVMALMLSVVFFAGMYTQKMNTAQTEVAHLEEQAAAATEALATAQKEISVHSLCSASTIGQLRDAQRSAYDDEINQILEQCAVLNLQGLQNGTVEVLVAAQVIVPSSGNAMFDMLRLAGTGATARAALSAVIAACGNDENCLKQLMNNAGWTASSESNVEPDGSRRLTLILAPTTLESP